MEQNNTPPRLLTQVRNRIRYLHYSLQTERAYLYWIRRYILFHGKKHPKDMGEEEIVTFLNFLATHENVAASTQNQALNALMFHLQAHTGKRHRPITIPHSC